MDTNKGFTLLELLIGITILVVVLFGLLNLHTQSFKLTEIIRNKTIALNAAQQEMERIRNLPYDDGVNDVLMQNGVTFTAPPLIGNGGADPGTITLAEDPDYPGDMNIREIIVSVIWISNGNLPGGTIRLVTRRCRY